MPELGNSQRIPGREKKKRKKKEEERRTFNNIAMHNPQNVIPTYVPNKNMRGLRRHLLHSLSDTHKLKLAVLGPSMSLMPFALLPSQIRDLSVSHIFPRYCGLCRAAYLGKAHPVPLEKGGDLMVRSSNPSTTKNRGMSVFPLSTTVAGGHVPVFK